jgi:hypothetical protein
MLKLLLVPAFVGLMGLCPAMAQGTEQQRAACERDADRLCESAIPDALAVEKCLRANMKSLSPACQRQFKAKPRG